MGLYIDQAMYWSDFEFPNVPKEVARHFYAMKWQKLGKDDQQLFIDLMDFLDEKVNKENARILKNTIWVRNCSKVALPKK